jgi:hypothetical protein
MGEEGHDQEFILIVEATGLDIEQVEALKKGFEGFDKVITLRTFCFVFNVHFSNLECRCVFTQRA